MPSELFNLECTVLDKLGRKKKTYHVGVYNRIEAVENAKQTIINSVSETVTFEVFVIEHFFP